jgi:5-methylcytosine-specific restriction endonuclease McrA
MKCMGCGGGFDIFKEISGDFGEHHAKGVCPYCDRFIKWIPKPKNEDKRKKSKFNPEKLNKCYCELCLRPSEYLGKHGQLEIHHIKEIHDKGEDEKINIWVLCSHCHSLVHHIRTYLNKHLKEIYEKAIG